MNELIIAGVVGLFLVFGTLVLPTLLDKTPRPTRRNEEVKEGDGAAREPESTQQHDGDTDND